MSNRTVPDLKELFKQASEIAQQVPDSMQEAAFNRAIDLLTGSSDVSSETEVKGSKKKRKGKISGTSQKEEANFTQTNDLLVAIDSFLIY